MKKWLVFGIVAIAVVGITVGVRGSNKKAEAEEEVTTINIAHTQNHAPYEYINEDGESDGYEVQVLKAIEKKLPQYKLKFTGTSDDDLLVGLESGKYDLGVKGAWYTEERAKKFIIPEEKIGASVIGFTIRKEDEKKYNSIDDIAKDNGKLVPISPQNAQWSVIEEYNNDNSDHPIELDAAETFKVSDAYAWVLEGRYDAYFDVKTSFEEIVKKDTGSYHQYNDQLSYIPYKGIPTFPLLHRDDKNEKFAEAYDKAIKELEEDGTLDELSEKYFGENVFNFIQE